MNEPGILLEVTRILFLLTKLLVNLSGKLLISTGIFWFARISSEIWLIKPNIFFRAAFSCSVSEQLPSNKSQSVQTQSVLAGFWLGANFSWKFFYLERDLIPRNRRDRRRRVIWRGSWTILPQDYRYIIVCSRKAVYFRNWRVHSTRFLRARPTTSKLNKFLLGTHDRVRIRAIYLHACYSCTSMRFEWPAVRGVYLV